MDRRKFIRVSAVGSVLTTMSVSAAKKIPVTPAETQGPFYPIVEQADKDFDLTQVAGKNGTAKGQHIFIQGKVNDTTGNPVPNVTVDLWQANAAGRYHHPHDDNTAPVDENFQSWAILSTNSEGQFNLKTVFPGAYPVSDNWTRPPHIHFKITKKGYVEVTTQMYFPNQSLNKIDNLIQRKTAEEQTQMIARQSATHPNRYDYTIVIEKA